MRYVSQSRNRRTEEINGGDAVSAFVQTVECLQQAVRIDPGPRPVVPEKCRCNADLHSVTRRPSVKLRALRQRDVPMKNVLPA